MVSSLREGRLSTFDKIVVSGTEVLRKKTGEREKARANEGRKEFFSRVGDFDDEVVLGDRVALDDAHAFDLARDGRRHVRLHLHRAQDDERVSRLDFVSFLNSDLDDDTSHGG